MKVKFGNGKTEYGPGVDITLSGDEVAMAIYTYLTAHRVHIVGPATMTMNGKLLKKTRIYVDPSGRVIAKGKEYNGKGKCKKQGE
jgi:hypothetical protein